MAQKIVTIRIQKQPDGTADIQIDPQEVELTDGDSLVFRTVATTALAAETPQLVFTNAEPFAAPPLAVEAADDPSDPLLPASFGDEAETEIVIDADTPAGDFDYQVQRGGAVSLAGRIKIIRQQ